MTETPQQIAARHGAICPPGLTITVCPPATFSCEEGFAPVPLRMQIAANYVGPKLRPKVKTPAKPKGPTLSEMKAAENERRNKAWYAMVLQGMTRGAAARAVGLSEKSDGTLAKWARVRGLMLPGKQMPKPNDRDLQWLSLVKSGMGKTPAARAVGLKEGSWHRVEARLVAHGHRLTPEAAP
jgi:hypothetical protein